MQTQSRKGPGPRRFPAAVRSLLAAAPLGLALVALMAGGTAEAAFPGHNGKIAFTTFRDAGPRSTR
jgi:hypothetical protein